MDSKKREARRTSTVLLFTRGLRMSAVFLPLALLSACAGGGPATPSPLTALEASSTAAAPPPPQSPRALAPIGTIAMVSSSPAAGASLAVGDCQFGSVSRICADGWRGVFEVSLNTAMRWPVLTVSFYDGEVRCGYAAYALEGVLSAGQTAMFAPTRISLSDEFGFSSPCPLPVTTTRMVAVLWSDADWTTQLRQEFAGPYTFVPR